MQTRLAPRRRESGRKEPAAGRSNSVRRNAAQRRATSVGPRLTALVVLHLCRVECGRRHDLKVVQGCLCAETAIVEAVVKQKDVDRRLASVSHLRLRFSLFRHGLHQILLLE
eukprot:5846102-Prymnesium_polylepis.1